MLTQAGAMTARPLDRPDPQRGVFAGELTSSAVALGRASTVISASTPPVAASDHGSSGV